MASLLNNFDDAEKALGDAMNAEGSALRENEKILESIQGKLNQFEAAWESLSNTIIDSDFLKWLVDSGTSLLKILDGIIEKGGTISTLLGVGTGIGAFALQSSNVKLNGSPLSLSDLWLELTGNDDEKTKRLQDKATKKNNNDLAKLRDFRDAWIAAGENEDARKAAIDHLRDVGDEAIVCANKMRALKDASDMDEEIAKLSMAYQTHVQSLHATTVATKALTVAKNMLASAGWALLASLATTALMKFGDWLYNNVLTTNSAREAMEQYSAELQDLQQNESSVRDLSYRFEELSQKTNRTAEEQQEFYDVQNQLKELMPELAGYYDAQNNFIVREVGGVQDLIAKYDDLIAKKRTAIATEYYDKNFMNMSPYQEDIDNWNRAQSNIDTLNNDNRYRELYDKYYDEFSKLSPLQYLSWSWDNDEKAEFRRLYNVVYKQQSPDEFESTNLATIQESANSVRSQLANKLLTSRQLKYADDTTTNALIEALPGASVEQIKEWSTYVADGYIDKTLKSIQNNLSVYQEIIDGELNGMTSNARAAVVDLGGLEEANRLMGVYRQNQEAIQNGNLKQVQGMNESQLAAVEAYVAWIETQMASGDALSMLKAVGLEAAAGGEITTETYNRLKDTFGECSEEWKVFEEKLAKVANGEEEVSNLEYAIDDLANAWQNLNTVAQSGNVNFSGLKQYQEQVNAAAEALAEYAENQEISHGTMAELQEVYGATSEEWVEFVEILHNEDATLTSITEKMNALVGAYLTNSGVLNNLNGSTKQIIASTLQQLGVTNALQVAEHKVAEELAAQALANENVTETASTFNEYIETQAELLGIDAALAQAAADKILTLKIQEAIETDFANMTAIETEKLIEMAVAAGWAGTNIEKLKRIQSNLALIEAWEGQNPGDSDLISDEAAFAAQQENKNLIADMQDWAQDNSIKATVDVDISNLDAYTSKLKDTTDKVSEAFQKMYDELQYLRDTNLISEEEYLARLLQLNEQFNKDNLEAYRKYQLEIFNGFKSMLSDRINKEADARIKALQKEREETEKYYDDLIEAEEEKLELLKKEWETEEYLLKIEQARAALQRAQQQKNVRIYKEGQGFVWQADSEEVNAATGEVNQAIQDYQRYLEELAIQERIDSLEEAKEQALEIIDEQIEAVEEWKENALEALEEVKMTQEDFLEFFQEFGISISEVILNMIQGFDEWANSAEGAAARVVAALGGSFSGSGTSGFSASGGTSAGNASTTSTGGEIRTMTLNGVTNDYKQDSRGFWRIIDKHASGAINIPRDEFALTDELGPELVIPGQGTFRKLKMGTSILPADISRNLWSIGQNPIGFASGIANMISNRKEENKTYQVNVGDIILHEVQNARRVADELKGLVLKAEQLAYSK